MKNTNGFFPKRFMYELPEKTPAHFFFRSLLEKNLCPFCGFTNFMSVKAEEGTKVRYMNSCLACKKGWRISFDKANGKMVVDDYDFLQKIIVEGKFIG